MVLESKMQLTTSSVVYKLRGDDKQGITMTLEEQIKALLFNIEQIVKYGWPDVREKDQEYEWVPGKKVTVARRDQEYIIETGSSQARLLNGYHGPLTVYDHKDVVQDPLIKETHLSKIIECIPDVILGPVSDLYESRVLTSESTTSDDAPTLK